MLKLFLVYVRGHESHTTIVVADNHEEAKLKSTCHPPIKELVDLGGELLCVDIDKSMSSQGYTISVSRLGMYH